MNIESCIGRLDNPQSLLHRLLHLATLLSSFVFFVLSPLHLKPPETPPATGFMTPKTQFAACDWLLRMETQDFYITPDLGTRRERQAFSFLEDSRGLILVSRALL
jgi:hypothetical protein